MAQSSVRPTYSLEVEERDQAGHIVATYISSHDDQNDRIDVSLPKNSNSWSKTVMSAFLPAGYPHSVTEDYLEYQIYDSLQAFSSSIAGLLASRAVLEGVGVGDANASPTAALLLSILQDSMGRIATILFAHRLGTSLEPECKMYRLAADVFNDAAIVLDCLSPAFPKAARVMLLSSSSILRALCGVAAGSSKASLSAHFATQGNLGELNAKDSSQETIISLLGMLAGSMIVSHITTAFETWSALLFLLTIHLGTNYLAVRAVSLRTLNRQRANIVFSSYMEHSNSSSTAKYQQRLKETRPTKYRALKPEEVSPRERIFEHDGVIRWNSNAIIGHCVLGIPLKTVLDAFPEAIRDARSGSYTNRHIGPTSKAVGERHAGVNVENLVKLFAKEEYILWLSPNHQGSSRPQFLIVLKENADTKTQLKAWFHAFSCAKTLGRDGKETIRPVLDMLGETLQMIDGYWDDLLEELEEAGWDTENGALETRSGTRVRIRSGSKKE